MSGTKVTWLGLVLPFFFTPDAYVPILYFFPLCNIHGFPFFCMNFIFSKKKKKYFSRNMY